MDELEISGRRHLSAKRAAREHRYHSDYIGQLIRSKKVSGQKVGRSWYVDAESLEKYLKGESQPTTASAPPIALPEEKLETKSETNSEEQKEEEKIEIQEEVPKVEELTRSQETTQEIKIEIKKEDPPSGLRFVPDEEPFAPTRVAPTIQMIQEQEVPSPPLRRRSLPTLALLAVCACAVAFGASSFLTHSTVVAGEQASAAVRFILPF